MAMKKWLSLLLAAILALGLCLPALAQEETAALPEVGEVLHGFEVMKRENVRLLSAEAVLFEHQKSGIELYYVAAKDINRAFDITFKTPALNEHGVPHVFEHAVLCGSEEYPYQNIVYTLMSTAYSTYVNASTYTHFTTYPVSSLSEDQLFVLADVYMDAVFHPNVLTDERIFKREAWRYDLQDADSPINLTGTVYSEMKGAITIQNAAYLNLLSAMMPDSTLSRESGGMPEEIPDMTWQELIDFHEAYYHPSNALIVLYGEMDLDRFLKHFDESYLSDYDRQDIEIDMGNTDPLSEPIDVVCEFPVEASTPIEKAGYAYYGFSLQGISEEDALGLALLASVLNHESSPFMSAVREKMPGIEAYATIDTSIPVPIFIFAAQSVDPEDAVILKDIADSALQQVAKDGLDPEIAEAMLASIRFSELMTSEIKNMGIRVAENVAMNWANYGDVSYFNNYLDGLDALEIQVKEKHLEALSERYLLNNLSRAMVVTKPAAGEAEARDSELAEKLQQLKAEMTPEEIDALVEETAALAAWGAEPIADEIREKITVLSVEDLPEEINEVEVVDETVDGVRFLKTEAQVNGLNSTSLMLNTAGVPVESLHDLVLYSNLIGSMDTEKYTNAEIETRALRYLNSFSLSASQYEGPDDDDLPALTISWYSLNGEYAEALGLVNELLYHTDFSDVEMLKSHVSRMLSNLRINLNNAPYSLLRERGAAAFDEDAAYRTYLSGPDLLKYYQQTLEKLDVEPEKVVERLTAIQTQLKNKNGAIVLLASDAEGISEMDSALSDFMAQLDDQPIEAADMSAIPVPAKREALKIDSSVQFNMVLAPLDAMGLEMDGRYIPISAYLQDTFLMPKIRHGLGAYAILNGMGREGFYFISYRDPTVQESFHVFDEMPEYIADTAIDQEMIDQYIISNYSTFATPNGALRDAQNAMTLKLRGDTQEYYLRTMREMKALTAEDIRALSDAFEMMIKEGARMTAGGAAAIEANAELYDAVVDLN